MKRLRFLVSLTNDTNDYQIEQAVAAQEAARRLDVDVQSSPQMMTASPRASNF